MRKEKAKKCSRISRFVLKLTPAGVCITTAMKILLKFSPLCFFSCNITSLFLEHLLTEINHQLAGWRKTCISYTANKKYSVLSSHFLDFWKYNQIIGNFYFHFEEHINEFKKKSSTACYYILIRKKKNTDKI